MSINQQSLILALFKDGPEFLKAPVPFSEILDAKIPLPKFIEEKLSFQGDANKSRKGAKSSPIKRKKGVKEVKNNTVSFSMQGVLDRGKDSPYQVNGEQFTVSEDAWVFGVLQLGSRVRVSGIIQINGDRCATKITVY